MASTTMTMRVRVRRLWPVLWWLKVAAALLPMGLSPERTVAIGNLLLGLACVECRAEGGPFASTTRQPLRARMVLDDGEARMEAY